MLGTESIRQLSLYRVELVQGLEGTYRKERYNLLKFIRSKIAYAEDAEDILQDVFFRAVSNLAVCRKILEETARRY